MPRYIDAEELTEHKYSSVELTEHKFSSVSHERFVSDARPKSKKEIYAYKAGYNDAIDSIVNFAPTADVRENVHAHWKIVYDEDCDSGGKYICGNCKHAFPLGAYFELCRFDYCPNCGAEMEEKDG